MIKLISKKIVADINYPHVPDLLKNWSRHIPDKISYKGNEYKLEYKLEKKRTKFKITYNNKYIPTEEIEFKKFKIREGQVVHDLLNYIISTLRTFDHTDLSFKKITPFDSIVFNFEIYLENNQVDSKFSYMPNFDTPIQFKYLYTQLEDHDGLEGFHFAFEDKQLFALGLLIEANHTLMMNDYNICILHCCTAIESCIFPILENYLKELLFNKGNANINSILKELPMNIKYEIIFGTIEKIIFEDEGELLEKLKLNNKLRNSIIHSGYSSSRNEAFNCLNDTSKFIGMLYLQMKNLE